MVYVKKTKIIIRNHFIACPKFQKTKTALGYYMKLSKFLRRIALACLLLLMAVKLCRHHYFNNLKFSHNTASLVRTTKYTNAYKKSRGFDFRLVLTILNVGSLANWSTTYNIWDKP